MRNELYHHGVEGQKWGVRNGPPYPLDKSNKRTKAKVSDLANKKTSYKNADIKRKVSIGLNYIKKILFYNPNQMIVNRIIAQENDRIFNENFRQFNEQAINQHMMDVMTHTYMHML